MFLDIDEDDNAYFNMPHAWNVSFEQPQIDSEVFPIDPSLATMMDPSVPTALGQTVVTIPEQLAEASRKVLIYFAQILEIPEVSEETIFIVEELETLEPIDEEIYQSIISSIINDVLYQ